jgi:hypothetical protein
VLRSDAGLHATTQFGGCPDHPQSARVPAAATRSANLQRRRRQAGFVKTRSDLPAPDLEVIFAPTYFLQHGFANPRKVCTTPSARARWGAIHYQ